MKRVLADHNVPGQLVRLLRMFELKTAEQCGWDAVRNGKLLRAAEDNGFDVLLTGDKTMHYEQNMFGRQIGVVSMSDNHWKIVRDHTPSIVEAIHKVKPGQVLPVFCGRFVPRKFRLAD